jgi:hypothetical protein
MNIGQYGVDLRTLQRRLNDAYIDYEWDNYLLQQHKISIIKSLVSPKALSSIAPEIWDKMYIGIIRDSDISNIFPEISKNMLEKISNLKPTRKRCVSEYSLKWKGNWIIDRIPSKPFSQTQALISNLGETDYRLNERKFKELPDYLFDDDLRTIMSSAANSVKESLPNVQELNIIVHHTVVYTRPNQISTNSPEGIHQDGMDFIVSVMVVERKNITGGKSIIYAKDKKTKLFEVELQPGQGILQPDLKTELWHEVTPIVPISDDLDGYRSIIGLDISVVRI